MSQPTLAARHSAPPPIVAPDAGVRSTRPVGAVLLLIGGLAAVLQLVLPWAATVDGQTTGWEQYYGVAHDGFAEILGAYAILVAAIAGLVMVACATRLFGTHESDTRLQRIAALAATIALICAIWWVAAIGGPSGAVQTFGWYLFLLAGVFGLVGIGMRMGHVNPAALLMTIGGVAAVVQLALPWFASGDSAVSGWQQYYSIAHQGFAEILAAYAILIGAIAGLILLAIGLTRSFGKMGVGATDPGQQHRLSRVAFVASIVLLACAAWWLVSGAAPNAAIFSFGWYLFLVSGIFGVSGAMQAGAVSRRIDTPSALLIAGGLAAVVQLALPWFTTPERTLTGWDEYYSVAHPGFMGAISAYSILIAAVAGVALIVTGFLVARSKGDPTRRRSLGTVALVAAIVEAVCMVWWLALGPVKLLDLFGNGSPGWYLFLFAGIVGAFGAGSARAKVGLSVDRISFMTLFLGLPLVIFLIFVASPFIQAFYYSMTEWNGFSPQKTFVGLDNYVRLFGDDKFRTAFINCVQLGIIVPLVTLVMALAIASLITVAGPSRGPVRGIKASSFYRVVSFFPYTIPAIVIGLIWAQVYNPTTGILNSFLSLIGLDMFESFSWLTDQTTALGATMFVMIWAFVGFYTVLFVAAIKGVSAEVYEAAKLDGASRFRTAISVTVPLIRDTVQTAYIYIGIAAIDGFVFVMALNPAGGPGYATLTMSQDLYDTAFSKAQFGYGTSMGVALAITTLAFATLVILVNKYAGTGRRTGRRKVAAA